MPNNTFTLTLSCAERRGIVDAVSAFLYQHDCDIAQHQQFDDTKNGSFFLRTSFIPKEDTDVAHLTEQFRSVAAEFGMTYQFNDCRSPGCSSWSHVWGTASTT